MRLVRLLAFSVGYYEPLRRRDLVDLAVFIGLAIVICVGLGLMAPTVPAR